MPSFEARSHSVAIGRPQTTSITSQSDRNSNFPKSCNQMDLDFGAYLLSSSPPINFAFSYSINDCAPGLLPISKTNQGAGARTENWSDSKIRNDYNGNINELRHRGLCRAEERASRWSADMSDNRGVKTFSPQWGVRDVSPGLRTRKNGCLTSARAPQIPLDKTIRSCLKTHSLYEQDEELHRESNGLDTGRSSDRNRKPSGTGINKKVSFADDIGRRLYMVRIFEETPDVPSTVMIRCNGCIKNIALPTVTSPHDDRLGTIRASSCRDLPELETSRSSSPANSDSSSSEPTSSSDAESGDKFSERCLLMPNFPMPAASYESFRRKIEQNCVSLETVHQVESTGNIWGTIKVKEIAYEKQVFVRVTFDGWESFKDLDADYVVPADSASRGRALPFATFSFSIPLPADTRQVAKRGVQFAVCFRAALKEYWDNNMGCNYEFTAPDWASPGKKSLRHSGCIDPLERRGVSQEEVFRGSESQGWGSYASWTEMDSTVPYW